MPSVAIKGASPIFATRKPLMHPTAAPITSPIKIVGTSGKPFFTSVDVVIPTSATTEPTDRSTPPRISTTVMPHESSRSKVSEVKIPEKLDPDRNVPGRSSVKATFRSAVKINSVTTLPSSTLLRAFRLVPIEKTTSFIFYSVVRVTRKPSCFFRFLVAFSYYHTVLKFSSVFQKKIKFIKIILEKIE